MIEIQLFTILEKIIKNNFEIASVVFDKRVS